MKLDSWLNKLLTSREVRVLKQRELLQKYNSPLLSLTINIPGHIKNSIEAEYIYNVALEEIEKLSLDVNEKIFVCKDTGYEALMSLNIKASKLKELACKLEESHPLGRFMDIDVLDESGKILSRKTPRKCYICEENAKECARNTTHLLEELLSYISKTVNDYKISI